MRIPPRLVLPQGLAIAALLVLAACASRDAVKAPPPPRSVIQGPAQRTLVVTASDSGAPIVLEPAQQLTVRLPVNVTAGLEWSLVDAKPGVVSVAGPKFERALRNTDIGEAAGASIWQFGAQASGAVTLSFELRRPRTLQPPVQTVSYSVTVK